jgi:MinD superfamily P-loop ATPase
MASPTEARAIVLSSRPAQPVAVENNAAKPRVAVKGDMGAMLKELVVVSGKGGTGKTSVAASLAILARESVIADCDVDAPDLHLVLSPRVLERHEFRSGHQAVIQQSACTQCGACLHCRFDAIRVCQQASGEPFYTINPSACEGCGICARLCPNKAIDFPERICGEWMVSDSRSGPMIHARLGIAAENSGKLVFTVRREARRVAEQKGLNWVIVDGPPGIGCPVIASITGASLVLVVTEPTVSGEHDLQRVLALTEHFAVSTMVCVNRWDINPKTTERIELKAREAGAQIAGRIRYDRGVTRAQVEARTVVETGVRASQDIHEIWDRIVHSGGINAVS